MTTALRVAALALLGTALTYAPAVHGQELEPRAYSNLPMGLNFLIAGYLRSSGGLATDPALPVEDAHLDVDMGLLAYARGLELWGHSGKFDVILPYAHLSGTALIAGEPAERNVSGLVDPRLRLSMNFYGAPALSLAQYPTYDPDLVIGASVQITPPLGQYDSTRLINLGTNRWSIKPDIGFSKTWSAVTVDLTAGVTFFSRNDDFFGGQTVERDPIYSTQANISYDFGRGIWAALGYTYYRGGRTTVDNVAKNDELSNSRTGLTVAIPVNRAWSVKFNASSGISTRTGTSFDTLGLALQYRWGEGF